MSKAEQLEQELEKLYKEAASAERCGALLKEVRGIWDRIARKHRELLEAS